MFFDGPAQHAEQEQVDGIAEQEIIDMLARYNLHNAYPRGKVVKSVPNVRFLP